MFEIYKSLMCERIFFKFLFYGFLHKLAVKIEKIAKTLKCATNFKYIEVFLV